jgi:phage repressor protein C with HTH and peptisase S24 domain
MIGMPQVTVNQYLNQERKFSFEFIDAILNAFDGLSAQWLIKGEGEMYKEIGKVFIDDKRLEHSIVPLYDVDVSAGLTRLFASGGSNIGSISIPNMPAADGAVHVTGDSMYPLIKPGDIIAYRVLNDISSITYGEIYILQLEHDGDTQVVVKYIKKSTQPDSVLLTSYNKEHDPMDVPRQWITQIARVAYTISKLSFI